MYIFLGFRFLCLFVLTDTKIHNFLLSANTFLFLAQFITILNNKKL